MIRQKKGADTLYTLHTRRSSGNLFLTNEELPRVASRRREVAIWLQKPFRGKIYRLGVKASVHYKLLLSRRAELRLACRRCGTSRAVPMFAVNTGTASSPLNVDATVTAKQAAEERRGSRFVRSCFSLAELERQVCHTGLEPRTSRLRARPALQPGLLLTRLSLASCSS